MELREGYKQTEVGVIPEDWGDPQLKEYVDINSGESPSKYNFVSVGIPYYKVEQLNVGTKYTGATPYMFKSGKTVSAGSIVFPKRGASILLNKIRILKKNSFMDTNLMTLTTKNGLFSEYLFYCLDYQGLAKVADTASIPQINNKHINPFRIPLPPTKTEQTAIANALSDADALIQSLTRLIAKKRQIKQGAMQCLLKPYENGRLKTGWVVKKLGEVGEIITGSTPPTQVKEYWDGSIPWITPTDIKSNKDIASSDRELSNSGLGVTRKLPANTVLVTCIASIGKNAILRAIGACNQQINAIIPNIKNNADFLYYLMEHSKQVLIGNAGITATLILSKKVFSEMSFIIPLLEEQTRIATILSDMDTDIAALETKLAKTRQIKQGMMQNLLTGRIRLI